MAGNNMTNRGLEKILYDNGYKIDRRKGSHTVWVKEGFNHIAINNNVNQMVAKRIIKENGLLR